MSYTNEQGRQQLLDVLAAAADELAVALASLGEAYEQLDEHAAEQLEDTLFRPLQAAYGRAKRTHSEFAARSGLPGRVFEPGALGHPSTGARGFLDDAVAHVGKADGELATLQDSMLPVEVGDPELRAGIAVVRELLGSLRGQAREIVRTLGR